MDNCAVLSDSEPYNMLNTNKAISSNLEISSYLTKNVCTDNYSLELQNSDKSKRIQEAKTAPGNEECMQQNGPLFGFIPIYGLKSRVYDSNKNPNALTV